MFRLFQLNVGYFNTVIINLTTWIQDYDGCYKAV